MFSESMRIGIWKFTLLCLVICLYMGCSYKDEPTPEFISQVKTYDTPAGTIWVLNDKPSLGQVVLFHGLTVDHNQYFHGQQARAVTKLWTEGYQIIFIDLPNTTVPFPYVKLKETLNETYLENWNDRIAHLLSYLDEKFGIPAKRTVGGISWGGLHSLMTAAAFAEFMNYFALIPVTDVKFLSGFNEIQVDSFSPYFRIEDLVPKHGFIAWAGRDSAVDPKASGDFVLKLVLAGADLTPQYHGTIGHEISEEMINQLCRWLDTIR